MALILFRKYDCIDKEKKIQFLFNNLVIFAPFLIPNVDFWKLDPIFCFLQMGSKNKQIKIRLKVLCSCKVNIFLNIYKINSKWQENIIYFKTY